MTKQDFELIARVVASLTLEGSEPQQERNYVAAVFADELAKANPRFDRARFVKACGAEDYHGA